MDLTEQKPKNICIRIAGVVVLYNSTHDVLYNISTYIDQIELLYVVDNSDQLNNELIGKLQMFPSIYYISVGSNRGIAYALNVAAEQAVEDGFTHLLTMDDDSKAPYNMIETMSNFLKHYSLPDKVGIVSVAHSKPVNNQSYKKVFFTMTSGNLLNLNAYKKVGPFDNALFIDHVDHEYGLRLSLVNYEIIEITALKLSHKLGIDKVFTLFGSQFFFISHSPERLYYLVRNGLYITKKYLLYKPLFCLRLLNLNIAETLKSILLESNKKKRIYLLIKAISDAWYDRLGKINY